ncbi:MAG: DUF1573 domain-containing protein [Planctomycetota bacterium]
MNRLSLLLLVSVSTLACAPDGAPGPTSTTPEFVVRRPELVADRNRVDFGRVLHGALLTAAFEIEVVGEHPLRIRAFNRSCGCADVRMVERHADGSESPVELDAEYPPGTRFSLEGDFNTIDKRGKQKQYVQIDARDTEELFLYHLDCEILSFFAETPLVVTIEGASSLGTGMGTKRLDTRDGSPVRLRRGDDQRKEIELDFVPIDPDDDGRSPSWEVTARVAPGTRRGKLEAKLEVVTDVPQPEATQREPDERFHRDFLHVKADVEGAVKLEPGAMDFPMPRPDQTVRRKVLIRNELGDFQLPAPSFELAALARERLPFQHPEAIDVTIDVLDPGKLWQVEVAAKGAEVQGRAMRGYVVLPIGHPLEPEVLVPFSVLPVKR